MSSTDIADPKREKLRNARAEPSSTKSNTDIADPARAKLRKLSALPK
jgi:hypothetical protein